MTNFQDVEEFLEHYGVLGMHWGERKDKPRPTSTQIYDARRKEAKAKTKLRSLRGGNSNYDDAKRQELKNRIKALKKVSTSSTSKEKIARNLALGSIGAWVAGNLSGLATINSNNPKVAAGVAIAQGISRVATIGLGIGAVGTGISANKDERDYHNR